MCAVDTLMSRRGELALVILSVSFALAVGDARAETTQFFKTHCYECHNADVQEGSLNLAELKHNLSDPENFDRWVRVYDRLVTG